MSLTVCCQWLESRKKRDGNIVFENSIKEKSLQLGRWKRGEYTEDYISSVYHNNVDQLIDVVPKLNRFGIKSFRVSSNVLPLFDMAGDIAIKDTNLINKFNKLGSLFKQNAIRVTTHPGQFTVLSSDTPRVVDNSIKELAYHAWMFDVMGFEQSPYYAINVHGGKGDRSQSLMRGVERLPDNVRNRLTLENDESSYNVLDLLKVHDKTGVPIVWDSHHHVFNTGNMSMSEACDATYNTWGTTKPLQHISNTEPECVNLSFSHRRKHSYLVHYVPAEQLELIREDMIDLDVEAKGKNLAVLKMRQDFNINC
jgi:UV DNA damage endonuclease